jgi:hypothetical protein
VLDELKVYTKRETQKLIGLSGRTWDRLLLCFSDASGIEFAYSISGRGRGPVAKLDKDSSPDRAA